MQRPVGPTAVGLNASGTGEVMFTPHLNFWWDVERLIVKGDSVNEPLCEVFLNGTLIDTTPLGNDAISDNPNPITLMTGSRLTVRWTNGTPGALHQATLFITEYRPDQKAHGFS